MMLFDNTKLVFDRLGKCDFCDTKTQVGITQYGTTNSNRLICVKCAEEIKAYDKTMFGYDHERILKENNQKIIDKKHT